MTAPLFDERAHAGPEHLDPEYVAAYDGKAAVDVEPDLELLQWLGLTGWTDIVDLGAGTGLFAASLARLARRVVAVDPSPAMAAHARGRGGFEVVEAGFLTYEHEGEPPDFAYSRNALHHLPDFWKGVALRRVADLLAPEGTLVLRDLVYTCEPDELDELLEQWFAGAVDDPARGFTREELATHVRTEHSTFSWLLEPLLEHAGFEIRERWVSESRTYARYVCVKR